MATVPTPYDWTAGVAPTASQLDSGVRDVDNFLLSPPQCSLYQSASFSVANNTWTRINWDSEHFDTDAMHSTSSNTGRMYFPTAGTYLVTLALWWAVSGTGYRSVNLTKNNGGVRDSSNVVLSDGLMMASTTGETLHSAQVLRSFSANDYIELWVSQLSGGALNLSGGYNKSTLQAIRLGS